MNATATASTVTLMGEEFSIYYLRAHPGVHTALLSGEIDGIRFRLLDGSITTGDTYLAERRNGVKLLTCSRNEEASGYIVPQENAYIYDTGECIKIELVFAG